MKSRLISLLAALVLAIGATVTVPTPAQAAVFCRTGINQGNIHPYGWARCTGSNRRYRAVATCWGGGLVVYGLWAVRGSESRAQCPFVNVSWTREQWEGGRGGGGGW